MPTIDPDVLDQIIADLDAENLPMEFIVLARITDVSGEQYVVQGEEMAKALRGPSRYKISEARLVLDVKRIRRAILAEVEDFYDEVYRNL